MELCGKNLFLNKLFSKTNFGNCGSKEDPTFKPTNCAILTNQNFLNFPQFLLSFYLNRKCIFFAQEGHIYIYLSIRLGLMNRLYVCMHVRVLVLFIIRLKCSRARTNYTPTLYISTQLFLPLTQRWTACCCLCICIFVITLFHTIHYVLSYLKLTK